MDLVRIPKDREQYYDYIKRISAAVMLTKEKEMQEHFLFCFQQAAKLYLYGVSNGWKFPEGVQNFADGLGITGEQLMDVVERLDARIESFSEEKKEISKTNLEKIFDGTT